ncbi:putative glycosyltransferase 6 domain-containing protein 1 [Hippopotamus amphibius kiboko]|uniref:putative glycosyltransferase 6 domain-containing protein 1 n=1 Tax=Hippopotamus amphibius kiboko TaxID=575201 RepID=UPI00259185CF|nr:putative glycosyltransferase 6 domain-containing protein 1 [Hippopotamus amphibius kiboko]
MGVRLGLKPQRKWGQGGVLARSPAGYRGKCRWGLLELQDMRSRGWRPWRGPSYRFRLGCASVLRSESTDVPGQPRVQVGVLSRVKVAVNEDKEQCLRLCTPSPKRRPAPQETLAEQRNNHVEELRLSDWFNPRKRPDVITATNWLAPIVWEGTFSREVLENHYRKKNLTLGLAVFATGRLADQYLELFLRSANKYFMTGYRVVFYIMVDTFSRLPQLKWGPLRQFKVFTVMEDSQPDDVHLTHMKSLGSHIVQDIQGEVDFLFSMTVTQIFQNHVGVEVLGTSVAQLHGWWYFKNPESFPYERRPKSAACIPFGQGDFYYDGAFVGGTPLELLSLVEEYLKGVVHDLRLGLNSTYEKYLNKYFFLRKPAKLLSPEYNWDAEFYPPPQVQYVKVAQQAKRRF